MVSQASASTPSRPAPAAASTSSPSASSSFTADGAHFRRGILPILLVSVLWGGVGLVSDLAPAAAPTSALGASAALVGGSLLFLAALRADPGGIRRLLATRDRRTRPLLAAGAVTILAYHQAFFPAVRLLGVAPATVLALGSAPLFAGAISRWVERKPLPARWTRCAPIAVAGCALVILGGAKAAGTGAQHTAQVGTDRALGVVLALIPGLAYAMTSIIAGRLIIAGYSSRDVMGAMFGGAALIAIPILAITGVSWAFGPRGAGVVLYLGAVTTYGCYTLFGRALRHTTAAVATTVTLSEGAVGALLGITVRGEWLTPVGWIGLGLLAVALTVLSLPARRAGRTVRSQPEPELDLPEPTPELPGPGS
jgi:drug/metabolite transporter, DME family